MNRHATPEAVGIADKSTILRVLVGSNVLGVALEGQDDRDEMGICVEPPEYVIGLQGFEQAIERTQPEGHRSGPGDVDRVTYSLRKWARLALNGNPTVLTPLFAPDDAVLVDTLAGYELRSEMAEAFLSKRCGRAFLGYLTQQRERMEGVRGGKHTNRPELIEQYGFDTKYAYHMVRLGWQGVELLTEGRLTLPMNAMARKILLELRQGKVDKQWALDEAASAERRIEELLAGPCAVPDEPDSQRVDRWLVETYQREWSGA